MQMQTQLRKCKCKGSPDPAERKASFARLNICSKPRAVPGPIDLDVRTSGAAAVGGVDAARLVRVAAAVTRKAVKAPRSVAVGVVDCHGAFDDVHVAVVAALHRHNRMWCIVGWGLKDA